MLTLHLLLDDVLDVPAPAGVALRAPAAGTEVVPDLGPAVGADEVTLGALVDLLGRRHQHHAQRTLGRHALLPLQLPLQAHPHRPDRLLQTPPLLCLPDHDAVKFSLIFRCEASLLVGLSVACMLVS